MPFGCTDLAAPGRTVRRSAEVTGLLHLWSQTKAMSKKSWLQRLQEQVVIHVPDERDREVQDLGFRAGYIVVSVAALGLSAYREVFTGQSGLILPTAAIVALPLLIPLGRRLLAGGLAPADERVRRIQTQAFRWAYVLLACGLTAYCMFR